MGLFDIFKSAPSSNAIANQVRRAKERYAQSDYRRMAMDKLLSWDTDEALEGILERFCVVVQSPHWDEEEKSWLVQEMVKRGEKVLPILRNFILEKNEVNHALLAYEQIVNSADKYGEILLAALAARPPSDHRSVQSKQEIIAALAELKTQSFDETLRPYLNDHSDDVQCAAINALASSGNEQTKSTLVDLLGSETHSARVLRCVASVISQKKFHVSEKNTLADVVKEDFRIEGGFLTPRHEK